MLYYENKYEKRLNIRTSKIENPETLADTDNHHYQGASYIVLYKVFNLLPASIKDKPFIDYGCGKGRALFVAEQCGFTKIIGIDIDKELLDDARRNLSSYQQKNKLSHFEFVLSDATTYEVPHDASVFYFFNPFGEAIMQKVAAQILKSFNDYPREVYIVYVNPKFREVFSQLGFKTEQRLGSVTYTEALIYSLK